MAAAESLCRGSDRTTDPVAWLSQRPWNNLLLMVIIRGFRGHFSPEHHHGVELPGIYWHFVDVMWIIVFTTVYIL